MEEVRASPGEKGREKIFFIWSFGFVIATTYRISFDSVLRVGGWVLFVYYYVDVVCYQLFSTYLVLYCSVELSTAGFAIE